MQAGLAHHRRDESQLLSAVYEGGACTRVYFMRDDSSKLNES